MELQRQIYFVSTHLFIFNDIKAQVFYSSYDILFPPMRWGTNTLHPSAPGPVPMSHCRTHCGPPVIRGRGKPVSRTLRLNWQVEQWKDMKDGLLSFPGSSLTGYRHVLLLNIHRGIICIMETSTGITQLLFFSPLFQESGGPLWKSPPLFFRDQSYAALRQIACARAGRDLREGE